MKNAMSIRFGKLLKEWKEQEESSPRKLITLDEFNRMIDLKVGLIEKKEKAIDEKGIEFERKMSRYVDVRRFYASFRNEYLYKVECEIILKHLDLYREEKQIMI